MSLTPESTSIDPHAATSRIVIDAIEWRRVRMRLVGRFIDSTARDALGVSPEFFVMNDVTGQRVTLPGVTCEDMRVVIDCNAMRLDGQDPLTAGTWSLFACGADADADEEPIPVGVAGEIAVPSQCYGGDFTTDAYSYRVLPSTRPGTGQFALAIDYQRAPRKPKPPGMAGLKRDTRSLMRRLRKTVFSATYKTSRRLVRKNGRRILFTSDSRSGLSGNLELIHARMIERGLDRDYQLTTAFKSSIVARRPLLDKFKLPYQLATADVILLDDFHPLLYQVPFAPEVRIIQLWHASGAFKTVGYSRVGKKGGPSPFAKSHKNYTHAIVSSEHDVPFYAEAFGLPEERVVATGIPRMDLFFDEEYKTRAIESVYSAMPELRDSRVILFAPTFRGSGPSTAYYDFDQLDLPALYELCVEQEAVFVFKMHPFVRETIDIPEEFVDRFVDATTVREINDLLLVADLVITDYSSLVFEYSTLKRPMLFFAYDLDEYVASRDFYEEFTAFVPGKIVRTFSALLEALRTGDFEAEKVERFAAEHLRYFDAGSTDRVIDQLILGREAS